MNVECFPYLSSTLIFQIRVWDDLVSNADYEKNILLQPVASFDNS